MDGFPLSLEEEMWDTITSSSALLLQLSHSPYSEAIQAISSLSTHFVS